MNVNEYIAQLSNAIDATMNLCNACTPIEYNGKNMCRSCVLEKHESKPCPMAQLHDVKRALNYAIKHSVNGITGDTSIEDPSVIMFMRRAVSFGYSIRTLRYCSDDYMKERNLIEVADDD